MSLLRITFKAWRTIRFVLLVLGLMAPAAASAPEDKAPQVVLPTTVIDLGKVSEGQQLQACFRLTNAGAGGLHIHRVKSNCGCTRVDYPQKLHPGAEGEVCLSIDTFGRYGPWTFKTGLYCNDPGQPVILLRVTADIAPLVTVAPDRVFFRDAAGRMFRQDVYIHSRAKDPLSVTLDSHNLGEKAIVNLGVVEPGRQYRLTVQNRMDGSASYRGRIILRTNHPGRERIVVPVFAHLTPPLAAYPSRLILKRQRGGKKNSLSGTLVLRAHDDNPFRILSIDPHKEGLTCRINTLVPDQAYRLNITKKTDAFPPPPSELHIKTNHPEHNTIVVPIEIE